MNFMDTNYTKKAFGRSSTAFQWLFLPLPFLECHAVIIKDQELLKISAPQRMQVLCVELRLLCQPVGTDIVM